MTKCWIFDIDGTLADCEHRLHHIQKNPKDWKRFFAEVEYDEPILHIVKLAMELEKGPYPVVFVSGRSDECRLDTLNWLWHNLQSTGPLYMRKSGDHRDDDIIKIEILEHLRRDGFDPIMAFDDRNRVVKAWRNAGVPCAQVADGDF